MVEVRARPLGAGLELALGHHTATKKIGEKKNKECIREQKEKGLR